MLPQVRLLRRQLARPERPPPLPRVRYDARADGSDRVERAQERGYASITPGRYLDTRHWISLGPGPGITERLITDAVKDSYDLVAERLPRRDRPSAR